MEKNIRIFRILFRNGIDWRFKIEEYENGICLSEDIFDSIGKLVIYADAMLSKFVEIHAFSISVDFKPIHDIEGLDSSLVQRCKPLTEEQEEEFWELFNKPNILIFDDDEK